MNMLKIGDWVTQYSKGYWQIVNIKPKYAEKDYPDHNYKKGDRIGSWVLMKKGFTPKMKFRIETDCCDSYWCKPVSAEVLAEIHKYFESHPKDYEKFCDTPYQDHPCVAVSWVNLQPEQVEAFKQAINGLPPLFTSETSMRIFREHGLEDCFTLPPSNYRFVCWHTVWELDENFDPLFKNPELHIRETYPPDIGG